ncbi:MAG: metallophosphoesterase [Bacteroidia bacterium]|nr:metallophosphoesterase [Bacteroidia bacterium]
MHNFNPRRRFYPDFSVLLVTIFLFSCGKKEKKEDEKKDIPVEISGPGHFLNLSDIHFNGFYDTTLVSQLYGADASGWKAIFEKSSVTIADGKDDTNYPLFKSFMGAAKKSIPKPDFILISGDFIAHEYNDLDFIKPFAARAGVKTDTWHASFIRKTMQFLAGEMGSYFPNVPVISSLGNNDAYCGDYHIQPGGDYLSDLVPIWGPLLPEDKGTFAESFPKAGYYALDAPFNPAKVRMIVLNTVLFSSSFNQNNHDFFCTPGIFGENDEDPGTEMLNWATQEIENCAQKGQKAWLVFHIPPGNDPNSCSGKEFYLDTFNTQFLAFLTGHAGQVAASFAGHYHRDDFRVITQDRKAVDFIHIAPAITTIYQNNPGFQVVHYDKGKGTLTDYSTWYTNLDVPVENPVWSKEYRFSTSYPGYQLEAASLLRLHEAIMQPGSLQDEYNEYYGGHPEDQVLDSKFWAHVCGQSNLTAADFDACMEGKGCE